MMKNIILILALMFVSVISFSSCENEALFDDLLTNQLQIVLKGTYESNNPVAWDSNLAVSDDSLDDYYTDTPVFPSNFYLDIANIALVNGGDKAELANVRKYFSFSVNDSDSFFNGAGVNYPTMDVDTDIDWNYVNVNIRKMIFDQSKHAYSDSNYAWALGTSISTNFGEEILTDAFDFNQLQLTDYYDTLKSDSNTVNRIYPLAIPLSNSLGDYLKYDNAVLEIRLVVKNQIKYYEYDYTSSDDGYRHIYHFWGLSDWLRDVRSGESSLGGNILGVARVYIPEKSVSVSGVAYTANKYIVAIPSGSSVAEYELTNTNRPGVNGESGSDRQASVPVLYAANNMEQYLQYKLLTLKYKGDDKKVETDLINGTYSTYWDSYEARMNAFKLPPLATHTTSGTAFEFTNVPTYENFDVYETAGIGQTLTQVGYIRDGSFIIK